MFLNTVDKTTVLSVSIAMLAYNSFRDADLLPVFP